MRNTGKKWMLMAAVFTLFTALNNPASQAGGDAAYTRPQEKESAVIMEVNFYKIDRQKADRGEFLGTAVLKDGDLEVKVKDPALEKLLKEPYNTIVSENKDNKIYDKRITFQPGTKEHLQAFAIECYKFGYIGEIVKK